LYLPEENSNGNEHSVIERQAIIVSAVRKLVILINLEGPDYQIFFTSRRFGKNVIV